MSKLDHKTPKLDYKKIVTFVQHANKLGLYFEDQDQDDRILAHLPYHQQLDHMPDSGIISNGAVYAFLDTILGAMVFSQFENFKKVATLDLRVDYFDNLTPQAPIYAYVDQPVMDHDLAYVTATAYNKETDQIIAKASAGRFWF